MDLKLHPDLKEPLKRLCSDPKTTIVVLSGSDRAVLDEVNYTMFSFVTSHRFLNLYNFSRTLVSSTCGWQPKMECSYAPLEETG